jgi:uncharacterized RDD family membrane protein YckC
MKCPKCGYLGFEHIERCRNCGYDFSLARPLALPELPIKTDAREPDPLSDLSFVDRAIAADPPRRTSDAMRELDRILSPAPVVPDEDLPLFGSPLPDDVPLITKPAPPRPPLAVRRATPEPPRVRFQQPRIELTLESDSTSGPKLAATQPTASRSQTSGATAFGDDATLAARFVAVTIDLLILLAIDATVVYFTMQICGISLVELGLLPRGPLVAFLLVQNGGYLVVFTAGGQTLGKMAAGIKVISTDPHGSVDFGAACLRELMWLVLALPAGLGLLTVFSRDRRGLHDRFAHTRVVRG